ncbi:MAG: UPF0147 family protein [Candidatus Aenigmarchaeota archaeon]|nr:UPF0147 family protein [Candidatus Aenigmarchaeota archaeon]
MAAQKDDRIAGIIEALRELTQDSTVPRNIKMKVESVIQSLAEDTDVSIRVNKALSELDEISDDTNLQAYTRTQIWNITIMLEMIHV